MIGATLCSGIGAPECAMPWVDWRWHAEIEPFPAAVHAAHFPGSMNIGDMTAEDFVERAVSVALPDIIVAGTPCQAFSVAGLRGSLADARGNLTLLFVRICDELDAIRARRGLAPLWIVWENVPGVYSTKDNAFGALLGGLVGNDAAIEPPRGKWTHAGVVAGPRRCAAWRLLDAQFFGLAQRRKRVFVFARGGAGDWSAADALLPIVDSVSWHPAPRREAGQRPAPSLAARTRGGGGLGTDAELDRALIPQTANAITASMANSALGHNKDENVLAIDAYNQSLTGAVSKTVASRDDQDTASLVARDWPAEIAPTLNAAFGEKQGLEDQHALGGAGLFVPAVVGALTAKEPCGLGAPGVDANHYVMSSGQSQANIQVDLVPTLNCLHEAPIVAHSLRAEGFDASEDGAGRGTPPVPASVYQDSEFGVREYDSAGTIRAGRIPEHQMVLAHALRAEDGTPLVPVAFHPTQDPISSTDGTTHAMGTGSKGGVATVAVAFQQTADCLTAAYGRNWNGNASATNGSLFAGQANGGGQVAVAFQPRIARNGRGDMGDLVNALQAQSGGTGKGDAAPCVAIADTLGVGANQTTSFQSEVVAAAFEENFNAAREVDVAPAMTTKGYKPSQNAGGLGLQSAMQVRRLTPRECERLQGFPDNWTLIPWRGKPAAECPDGPRYKALGNSMAVPCLRYLGERILAVTFNIEEDVFG